MQLQNFLMKHIHGLLYLADERVSAADVIEAKIQAIEARKDPSLPFVLAKVRSAPIPPALMQDLRQFGVEPGQQPSPYVSLLRFFALHCFFTIILIFM